MNSHSLVGSESKPTLFNIRTHFASPSNIQPLRLSDASWFNVEVERVDKKVEAIIQDGRIPAIFWQGKNIIAGSAGQPLPPIPEEEGDWDPVRDGPPKEVVVNCGDGGMTRVYGPTSFTGWTNEWEHLQINNWLLNIITNPYPTVMLTAIGHFADSHAVIPGVRVGSDLRAYQRMSPVVHRMAVLGFVGIGQDWFYVLIFVYGDEYWDEPGVSEKVGILRVPRGLIGPSFMDPAYDDEPELIAKIRDWTYFNEANDVGVVLALPTSHPRPALEVDLYDSIPSDARLDHRLRIDGSKILSRRFEL